jgi:hypothetical protein
MIDDQVQRIHKAVVSVLEQTGAVCADWPDKPTDYTQR